MPSDHRFNNFVARYWRGEYSLGLSYWIFGFIGDVGSLVVVVVIGAAVGGFLMQFREVLADKPELEQTVGANVGGADMLPRRAAAIWWQRA
jgi:hypothetical protein